MTALPTLAFGRYVDPDPDPCHRLPRRTLVRPAAAGQTYDPPTSLAPGYCALSILFSDWSRSGRRDLRLTNDRHYYRDGEEQLWRIVPGQAPRHTPRPRDGARCSVEGMGIASRDVTGDGLPEVFLTSQGDEQPPDTENGPDAPTYRDIALGRGVRRRAPVHRRRRSCRRPRGIQSSRTSTTTARIDLFVCKGNVEAQLDFARRDPSNLFIGQADGTFVEGADRPGSSTSTRSVAPRSSTSTSTGCSTWWW